VADLYQAQVQRAKKKFSASTKQTLQEKNKHETIDHEVSSAMEGNSKRQRVKQQSGSCDFAKSGIQSDPKKNDIRGIISHIEIEGGSAIRRHRRIAFRSPRRSVEETVGGKGGPRLGDADQRRAYTGGKNHHS